MAVIVGLGSDLCDIRRIERAIERHGQRFLQRCFTETERAKAVRRTDALHAATFAKRWAAKEACAKALGTGFSQGVFHSDMGVRLTGGALARLERLMPPGHRPLVLLSMTDEPPYAFAQVMIQAVADPSLA